MEVTEEGKPCFMETSSPAEEQSALAAAGSTSAPADVHLPVTTTLHQAAGQAYKKVIGEEERGIADFFSHPKSIGNMEDKPMAKRMTNLMRPMIQAGTAKGAMVFKQNTKMQLVSGRFEDNTHFQKRRKEWCGTGASGEVTAYMDTETNTTFVKKRIKEGKRVGIGEIESMLKLDHRNICKIYAFLFNGTTVDLLLQDAGYPLRDCLKKLKDEGIRTERYWQVVMDLARQGFEANAYMHTCGICHLDIKPENLLVHQNSQRKLVLVVADFGTSLTMEQMMSFHMQLTPEYWPPEMWHHVLTYLILQSGKVESNAFHFPPETGFDTWAMGLVVYFMGTLQHLLQWLEFSQDAGNAVIPPEGVQQLCQQLGAKLTPKFAFQLMLMTQRKHRLPEIAANGPWLFPDIPPALLQILQGTLNPDPQSRWTDEKAVHFLSGKPLNASTESDEACLKTPTPVDETSYIAEEPQTPMTPNPPVQTSYRPAATQQVDAPPATSRAASLFQARISKFWTAWDNDVGSGNILAATNPHRLEGAVASDIATPTSTYYVDPEDIALRPAPGSAGDSADCKTSCTKGFVSQRPRLGGPLMDHEDWPETLEEDDMQTVQEVEVDLQTLVTSHTEELDLLDHSDTMTDDGLKNEIKGHAKGVGEMATPVPMSRNDVWVAPVYDTVVSYREENLGAFSVKPKPMSFTGKGERGGKKSQGKGGKYGRPQHKGVSHSAPMKASGPGKQGVSVRGKKRLPSEFLEVTQPAAKIPFVVASSSCPKPSARTMQDLPSGTSGAMQGFALGGSGTEKGFLTGSSGKGLNVRNSGFPRAAGLPQPSALPQQQVLPTQAPDGTQMVAGFAPQIEGFVRPSDSCKPIAANAGVTNSGVQAPIPGTAPAQLAQGEAQAQCQVDLTELLQLLTNDMLGHAGLQICADVDEGLQHVWLPQELNVEQVEQPWPDWPMQLTEQQFAASSQAQPDGHLPCPSAASAQPQQISGQESLDENLSDMMLNCPVEANGNVPYFTKLFDADRIVA